MEATRCGPTLKPDAGVARQRVARQEVSHAIKRLKHIQSAPLEDLNADGVALPAGDLNSRPMLNGRREIFARLVETADARANPLQIVQHRRRGSLRMIVFRPALAVGKEEAATLQIDLLPTQVQDFPQVL